MALVRLALRNLQQRICCSSSFLNHNIGRKNDEVFKRFMAATTTDDKKEVTVTEGDKKPRLFPRRRNKRSLWNWNWRNKQQDYAPSLYEYFPSGLGNALLQATENMNRLFDNLNVTPSHLMWRVKEQDNCYKLKFDVPGLSKEEVKITIDDGVLNVKGEHREEDEEGADDDQWSSRRFGYYNTSLVLPDDAKLDEIKAELKDGVLSIVVPRTEHPKKDVKEIQVN